MMFCDFFEPKGESGDSSNSPFGGSGLAVLYVVLFKLSIDSSRAARRARLSPIILLSTSVISNSHRNEEKIKLLVRLSGCSSPFTHVRGAQ